MRCGEITFLMPGLKRGSPGVQTEEAIQVKGALLFVRRVDV